jgi:plastocyanin
MEVGIMFPISLTSRPAARGRRALRAVLGAGLSWLAACGGGASSPTATNSPPPPTGPTDVTVVNNSFSPASLGVAPGTTVTWTWNTCSGGDGYGGGVQTCVDHNIVFDADATTSGTQSQGSYQRRFSTAGTYAYHCSIHGAAMSGKIVVQ